MPLLFLAVSAPLNADDSTTPQRVRHQITGLFSPDRVEDLEAVCSQLPEIKLIRVDYDHAEAIFEYDPQQAFPGGQPEQQIERFDQELKKASNHTFGIKPLRTTPMEQLQRVEILVNGLDCKGCSYAAYCLVYQLTGVEMATASFRDGKVTALIDPEKIRITDLEEALKKGGVELPSPE